MNTFLKNTLLVILAVPTLILAPSNASAESLIAHVTSVSTNNDATNRHVFVQVSGGVTCGNNAGTAFLRWRLSEVPKNYEEGVQLLISALLSHAGVVFDVTDVGSDCRINSFIVAAP
jgi:hypothetical protein